MTRLPISTRGGFASSEQAGSIGTGVLKKFTVTFDFPNQRLYLTANSATHRRDPWDGAGMWLVRDDVGFEVYDVLDGGPADLAGIEPGDVIVAVDNQVPAEPSLLDVRRLLSGERPDAVVRLAIRRDPNTRNVDLELKRIL